MEEQAPNSPDLEPPLKHRRRHRRVKPQMLTMAALDRRSNAYRLAADLTAKMAAEAGGLDQLTIKQRCYLEGFIGSYIIQNDLLVRILQGEKIDLAAHAAAVSSMVRVGSRLPDRFQKDVTPSLEQYLREHAAEVEA